MSGGRPSFAVVIPTYNRAVRLQATLDTVFAQEEAAGQVIVVDDCSTDETPDVMSELTARHPELVYIRHEENAERAAARNTGMASANTDYVTFLDSDDFMYPRNLREAADFAEATGAKFFHNRVHVVDEAGNHLRNLPAPRIGDHLKTLSRGNFPSCIGVFIHREIYTKYRFDTSPVLTISEDYELWLRVAADHPIHRLDRFNNAVVEHPGRSMLNQDTAVAERRMAYILDKVRSDPHLSRVYAPYLGLLEASRMVFLAGVANENREAAASLRYLRRALRVHPGIATGKAFIRSLQLALMTLVGLRR